MLTCCSNASFCSSVAPADGASNSASTARAVSGVTKVGGVASGARLLSEATGGLLGGNTGIVVGMGALLVVAGRVVLGGFTDVEVVVTGTVVVVAVVEGAMVVSGTEVG